MPDIKASIVIPVHDNWRFTRNCLESLHADIVRDASEVIVVDNASTDETPLECPELGRHYFGCDFRYIRNETNRNFAGACNQGALAGRGRFLIFLNNDTEVQQGWLPPLIRDFAQYPDIAATGPLLLYPKTSPLGHAVQHLGVFISPYLKPAHLYQGIPAASPLAQKRRFFQAITAACMAIPKILFLEHGGFDERYVNGFEDVDLCARLCAKGMRMTVNPDSRVIHHESQTAGRHDSDYANSELLEARNLKFLYPDWHKLVADDGLELAVTPWLTTQTVMRPKTEARLNGMLEQVKEDNLVKFIELHPYWQAGWKKLAAINNDRDIWLTFLKLFSTPENASDLLRIGLKTNDDSMITQALTVISSVAESPRKYLHSARTGIQWCKAFGLTGMISHYEKWLHDYSTFEREHLSPLFREVLPLAAKAAGIITPFESPSYNLWLYGHHFPEREGIAQSNNGPGFSIIMLAYEDMEQKFLETVESICAQKYENWELYIVSDKSELPILQDICKEKSKIELVTCQKGKQAVFLNSALEKTDKDYCIFINENCLLEKDALSLLAKTSLTAPEADLLYADDDRLDNEENFVRPNFRDCRWEKEVTRLQERSNFFAAWRKDSFLKNRIFEKWFNCGALNQLQGKHVPYILAHWRANRVSELSRSGEKSLSSVNNRNIFMVNDKLSLCPKQN